MGAHRPNLPGKGYMTAGASGFSLVELSIVLVILGLLVGGVLGGQALINAAELRKVTSDMEKYHTSINAFRVKYHAIPGDMRNAVRFWGAAAGATTDGVDATCAALTHTSPSTGTETCNGNGDGMVQTRNSTAQNNEGFRAWQQLANAGLMDGSFTGVPGSGSTNHSVPGENIPETIRGAGFAFVTFTNGPYSTGNIHHFPGEYVNVFRIGKQHATGNPVVPFLTPEEAWNIDTKADDGMPGTGRIVGYINTTPDANLAGCTTTDDPATSQWDVADATVKCVLIYDLPL